MLSSACAVHYSAVSMQYDASYCRFFDDPVSTIGFYFLKSQRKICCKYYKQIKADKLLSCEVVEELGILANKI